MTIKSVSEQIDVELFQWAAALGIADRAGGLTIRTKEQFNRMEAAPKANPSLLTDMYRAYRVGYNRAFQAITTEEKESV